MKDKKPAKKAPVKKEAPKKAPAAKKPAQAKKPVAAKPAPVKKPAPAAKKEVFAADVRALEQKIENLTGDLKALQKRLDGYDKEILTLKAGAVKPIVPPTPAKTMFDTIDFSAPAKKLDDAAKVADKTPAAKGGLSPIAKLCATMHESKFGVAAGSNSPFCRK